MPSAVDVVVDQFEAVNERDFQRAMDAYAGEVVLLVSDAWGITSGTYEGRDAVGEWFGDWFRQFDDDYRFEIKETRDLGSGGLYLLAEHGGSGRTSGVPIGSASGYLYRVREGKIVRVELYSTAEDALEAASLPEWSEPKTD